MERVPPLNGGKKAKDSATPPGGASSDPDEMDIPIQNVNLENNSNYVRTTDAHPNARVLKKSISEHIEMPNKKPLNGNQNGNSSSQKAANTPQRKISYDLELMYKLRDSPASQVKPDLTGIHEDIIRSLTRNASSPRLLDDNSGQNFAPSFMKGGRGGTPNRRSQHGKQGSKSNLGPVNNSGRQERGPSNSASGNKPNLIQIVLSKDVKLNECENAWKPSRAKKDEPLEVDPNEAEAQEIYKKVRSILNKVTPQNFRKLIAQIKKFNINTHQRLSEVINLIFEKAIDEPNFSSTYALMCKELEQIKVTKESPDNNNENELVSFKQLILIRCRTEFEKGKAEESLSSKKLREIEECTDLEKKKLLQLSLEEDERKARVRSVGNVRFIGELYKLNYIRSDTMVNCIESLIKKVEEDTMECLCKLLTTIGQNLEVNSKINLQVYFNDLRKISEDKNNNLNSRIRFMIKDLIDLRMSCWIPRQKLNPSPAKMETEWDSDARRGNDRSQSKYGGSGFNQSMDNMYSGRSGGSRSCTEETGWSPVTSSKRSKQINVNSNKLRSMNIDPMKDISLQPPNQFTWGKGSASGKKEQPVVAPPKMSTPSQSGRKNSTATKTSNSFNVLAENSDPSHETSLNNQNISSSSKPTEKLPLPAKAPPAPKKYPLKFLQDSLTGSGDPYAELLDCILLGPTKEEIPALLRDLIIWGLELKKNKIIQVIGRVTGCLVNKKIITSEKFLDIFKDVIDSSGSVFEKDSEIWDLLAKFVWAHSGQNELTFSKIHSVSRAIIEMDKGYDFLMALMIEKVEDSNETLLVKRLWEESNRMELTDWMSNEKVQDFLICMPLDFLSPCNRNVVTPDTLCEKMLELMNKRTSMDAMNKWIAANIGESINERWFVRGLTEALYTYVICDPEHLIPRFESSSPKFTVYNQLLVNYVSNNGELEFECLLTLQNLMNKLEHPQSITLAVFENLWESEIISNDTFMKWESDTTHLVGKGVMLKMLTSFFTALRAEVSSDDISSVGCD